jgi:hypothetical protein
MRTFIIAGLLCSAVACEKSAAPTTERRVTLHRTGGTTFELLPNAGQYPHCLVYTVAKNGVIRQLTMAADNKAVACPAGQVVAGHAFKVPLHEGPVRVFVFLTTQQVSAGSLSQQILEAADRQHLSVMNMRIPGDAMLEVLDFAPESDVAAVEGGLLVTDAGPP